MEPKTYLKRWEAMKSERSTTETMWQEVADYSFPKRDFTTTRTPGVNRNTTIYDSTGTGSVLMLASALHGNLTPTQTKWLFLKSEDETRPYFDYATGRLLSMFSSYDMGFAAQAHEFYMDIVAFGTAVMGIFAKKGKAIFKTLNLNDCWIDEDEDGTVDTLYYSQKYTAEQMVNVFGKDNVHDKVLKQLEDNGEKKKFTVLYCVEPRHGNSGRGAVSQEKPWKAVYVDVDNKHNMDESGYDEFPFIVSRFSKRSGEKYGWSPGMSSYSEVRMLNKIVEVMIRAATKNADPPILSPIDGVILPMRLDPGGINYYDPDVGVPQFWNNNFRPDYMDSLIERKRLDIQRMFFIDFLTLPDKQRMSATETVQRSQDSFRNMSAINARLETEFLNKAVKRTFSVGVDIGYIDQPPEEAQGEEIDIEYTSPMAMAQKSIASNSVLQGLSVVAQTAQFDPSVANIVNAENIARDQMLNTYFMPASYVRSEEEVQEIKDQQQEAQAQAQAAESIQGYASGAKDAADAVETLGGV